MILLALACSAPTPAPKDDASGVDSARETGAIGDSGDSADSGTDPIITPGSATKLVIVVLDGVRIEDSFGAGTALDGAATESILPGVRETLLPIGALVTPATQTGATSTAPGHCDLLSGRNVPYGHFNIQEVAGVGDYIPEWPTFIQAFLANSERTALLTGDTPHTAGLVGTLYPGLSSVATFENIAAGGIEDENDTAAIDGLLAHMQSDAPDFALVNLHAADTFGHMAEAEQYMAAVRATDANLLRVWGAIQTLPAYRDQTLLVITADHGRHRLGNATDWEGHGDVCTGCREVPIFIAGPGAAQGVSVATSYALIDLAPTLAALLGVDMPFAEGLVMSDLLGGDRARERRGVVELSGAHASVELLDDPAHRSRVVVDGVELSDPLALEARGPIAMDIHADRGGTMACWRELDPAGTSLWSWHSACSETLDGVWTPFDFPLENVDPWWTPALAEVGEEIWTAWVDNAGGGVPKDDEPPQPVPVARRVRGAWVQSKTSAMTYFPATPALAGIGADAAVLAYVGSDTPFDGRYTRRVRVMPVVWATGTADPTWIQPTTFDLSADGVGRQERPAMRADGVNVGLAFLAYGGGETWVYGANSADGGGTWTAAVRVSTDERVLPEIAPVWDRFGRLWWGALAEDGSAEACNATLTDGIASAVVCTAVGSSRIAGLAAAGPGVRVSIDRSVGEWTETAVR